MLHSAIPKGYDWPSLLARDGDGSETHYRHVLDAIAAEIVADPEPALLQCGAMPEDLRR